MPPLSLPDVSLPDGLSLTPSAPSDNPAAADLITRVHPDWPRTAADLDRFDALEPVSIELQISEANSVFNLNPRAGEKKPRPNF